MSCPGKGTILPTCGAGFWGELVLGGHAGFNRSVPSAVAACLGIAGGLCEAFLDGPLCGRQLPDTAGDATCLKPAAAEESEEPAGTPGRSCEDCVAMFAATEVRPADGAPQRRCYDCGEAKHACLGGTLCAAGHHGTACGDCAAGHYRLGGRCHACPSHSSVVLIAAGAGFLLTAAAVYAWGGRLDGFVTLHVLLTHGQLLATFANFEANWPHLFRGVMRWLGALAMFNVDFAVHPECTAPVSPFAKWLVTLGTPFYFALLFALWYGCAVLRLGCRAARGDTAAAAAAAAAKARVRGAVQVLKIGG